MVTAQSSAAHPQPAREPNKVPIDLRADGLLWLINRSLLHPRGFALAYTPETHTFELWGNGDEPWQFSGIDENELFRAIEAKFDEVRSRD